LSGNRHLNVRFRELLDSAEGQAEFVIAVVVDVRGFSSFAMKVESMQTAAYLKRVYQKLLDNYFHDASFYKPTGDGLLATFTYTEASLKTVAANVMESCMKVIDDFPRLCEGDEMVNFDVPDKLGIGLCRGAASRLVSDGMTLDYSGRPLNIASRLMDLARPSGLVVDATFGTKLIPPEIMARFSSAEVYPRGMSLGKPMSVLFTRDLTVIPPSATQPPAESG